MLDTFNYSYSPTISALAALPPSGTARYVHLAVFACDLIVLLTKYGGQTVRWRLCRTPCLGRRPAEGLCDAVARVAVVAPKRVMPVPFQIDRTIISIFMNVSKRDCLLIPLNQITFPGERT